MAGKNLALVVVAHQGYIRHAEDAGDYAAENNILFTAISRTYLPLLAMLRRLEADKISVSLSLVLSPTLCALLDDPIVQKQYIDWLDARIALGERECVRCKDDVAQRKAAEETLAQYRQNKIDFTETYAQNLVHPFVEFARKGYLELLATAGTHAFFPHYADMTEVLNAQVEAGLYAHRQYFGRVSEGFWLPYLGYADGVEKVLRSYGINYTVLDTAALLFSQDMPSTGVFAPVRSPHSLVLFGRDSATPRDIMGEGGFMHDGVYKNLHKDIGFDLDADALGDVVMSGKARVATGYCYRTKSGDAYDADAARAQAERDAARFVAGKKARLEQASALLGGKDAALFCVFDAALFGQEWAEGMVFLEAVLRHADGVTLTTGARLIERQFALPKITPYPSAACGAGYGEDLLDSTNGWMLRYTRKMCERMVDLAGRFPDDTGLKARLLNLGAKELMIAQGGEWAAMLHEGRFPEYVRERFRRSIAAFIAVFDSLGSNTVSTEWLTQVERADALFPWMNYRIFSRKE